VNIEQLIYEVFKAEIDATYRHRSPTPGTGTYLVLDLISDISRSNKDIHLEPNVGGKIRVHAKAYGPEGNNLRTIIEQCQTIIRTTRNHTVDGVTWVSAFDEGGITAGYDPKTERYYYIIDFLISYNK